MKSILARLLQRLAGPLADAMDRNGASARHSGVAQQALLELWHQRQAHGEPAGDIAQFGFRQFSQNDEDGILLYIFSALGMGERRAVEICAGDGIECNAANLLINHQWHALLVDGDPAHVARGRAWYGRNPCTRAFPPVFVQAWVTVATIDSLCENAGFRGEVDLLSIDLDGMDYWIWKALTVIEPRVVVVEFQDIIGPEKSITVPYAPDFNSAAHSMTDRMPNYAGASLRAFQKLGAQKGYRLVGVNELGFNAFFVKRGLGEHVLPEVSVESCFSRRKQAEGMTTRWPLVSHLPWEEV